MIQFTENFGGVEITTQTCGISGRICLDLEECVEVQEWLSRNLAPLRRAAADQREKERLDEIARLQDRIKKLAEV